MVDVTAAWLTAARLERLRAMVQELPAEEASYPRDVFLRIVWRDVGGAFEELDTALELCRVLGLAVLRADRVYRTPSGFKLCRSLSRGDFRPLGLFLIRSGRFSDQASRLLETGAIDSVGDLVCQTRAARIAAPQLVGVLQWWDVVTVTPSLRVPEKLVKELRSVWSLAPPPPDQPQWLLDRKVVGNRAELYTLQLERSETSDLSKVLWVARDNDALGWDVENRGANPVRYIEVKGRRDRDVVFFLSENELEKSRELGPQYEIHFWGQIDLNREPAVEYALLRELGYPHRWRDPQLLMVDGGPLLATAVQWRVTLRESVREADA